MRATSVAVTSLWVHCFDKNFVFLYFLMKEVSITICCSSLSASVLCVCSS